MKKNLAPIFGLTLILVVIAFFSTSKLLSQESAKAPTVVADPHATCTDDHTAVPAVVADPHAGHNHGSEAAVVDKAADPHAGHNHASEESPVSKPIKELLAEDCEHSMKMIDCDECRYELGAVKVPDQVKGMLKTQLLAQVSNRKEISFRGELEYDNQLFRTVTSVVPGIIASMSVRKGDHIEQGQIVAIVESRELSHTALELQMQISELELAQKKLAREEMLNEKKVGAMQSVQEARAARDLVALEIKRNKEELALFGLSSKEISAIAAGKGESIQKGQLKIASPIQGRIANVNVNIGSAVNEQQALVEIVNIKQLRAVGQIKETDIATIIAELNKHNINGFISTQAFPGMLYPVKAVSADAGLKPTTRMLEIQLEVKNPDELLRPGMFIEGTLQIGEAENKPTLPAAAVLEDEGKQFVFVKHNDSMYFRRDVTIESKNGDSVTIGGGITDGDEIVIEGSFLLKSDILRGKMGAGCAH